MAHKQEQGVTLLEVMAALVVVSLGVFAAAQLQVQALQAADGALRRSQAVQVAQDLLERVRASGRLGGEELGNLRRNTELFAGASGESQASMEGGRVRVSVRWADGREEGGRTSLELGARSAS